MAYHTSPLPETGALYPLRLARARRNHACSYAVRRHGAQNARTARSTHDNPLHASARSLLVALRRQVHVHMYVHVHVRCNSPHATFRQGHERKDAVTPGCQSHAKHGPVHLLQVSGFFSFCALRPTSSKHASISHSLIHCPQHAFPIHQHGPESTDSFGRKTLRYAGTETRPDGSPARRKAKTPPR